jgi:hypothetical protein
MENLDITTIILVKSFDLELQDLLLADLQQVRVNKAA